MQKMVNKPVLTQSSLLLNAAGLQHGFTNSSFSREEIASLDSATATAKQVHQDKLLWVDAFEKRARDADGLATFTPGLSIGVFSADCTPLLAAALHPSTNKVYAAMAVHAGWRGTALGIAGKAFSEFARQALRKDKEARFLAAIGPCISRESFEVGEDVVQAFPGSEANGLARFLRTENGKPKYLFDLPGENLRQLRASAQEGELELEVDMLGLCTLKLADQFPSFRRDREKAGRILSFLRFDP